MTMTAFEHGTPWTEEEFFGIGETSDRVELLDGGLVVTPSPNKDHQTISRRLANLLEPPADAVGLEVYEAINLRLRPGRIPIPDLVMTRPGDDDLVVDAHLVVLVVEITSPSNAMMDRFLKLQSYAEARIPWYLLIEPDPVTLKLFRLDGAEYVLDAKATEGETLMLTEPIRVEIDPAALVRRRPA
jgi:Uma2 family endonuclease